MNKNNFAKLHAAETKKVIYISMLFLSNLKFRNLMGIVNVRLLINAMNIQDYEKIENLWIVRLM
jgi:hypothetical protein